MKKWYQKAILQKIISYLPLSHKINYFCQKYVTKGLYLSDILFYDRLNHAKENIEAFQKYIGKSFPANCLEIGTGWYPIVPVSYFLVGADKIYSVDISFHLSKNLLKATLQKFVDSNKEGLLKNYIDFRPDRLDIINKLLENYDKSTLLETLQKLNITYLIEYPSRLSLPDNSIELVCSNNTLEHIYIEYLIPILKELRRVVKKQYGLMSHFIDMTDHFAHFDKSISIYNFLKFSDKQWKWIDNSIAPQNRLRIYDYKQIYTDLNIPVTEEKFRNGNIQELKLISLNNKFASHSLEEVAKSHCLLISYMKL